MIIDPVELIPDYPRIYFTYRDVKVMLELLDSFPNRYFEDSIGWQTLDYYPINFTIASFNSAHILQEYYGWWPRKIKNIVYKKTLVLFKTEAYESYEFDETPKEYLNRIVHRIMKLIDDYFDSESSHVNQFNALFGDK